MPLATLFRSRPLPATAPAPGEVDRALLERFTRSRDQQAFAELVRRYGPAVLGVCRRVLRDPHAADDAFQATFLTLARKAPTIARPEALGGWLYGVALRVALKARLARRHAAAPLPDPVADTPDPSAGLAAEELRLVLDEELCRMPERDRVLLVLVYLEGKTHDEAARAIGCPLGSVAWRLNRAREDLRRRLARRGVALSVGLLLLLGSMGRGQAVPDDLVGRTVVAVPPPDPPGPAAPTGARRLPMPAVLAAALLIAALAVGAWAALDPGRTSSAAPPDSAEAPATSGSCH